MSGGVARGAFDMSAHAQRLPRRPNSPFILLRVVVAPLFQLSRTFARCCFCCGEAEVQCRCPDGARVAPFLLPPLTLSATE